MFDKLSAKGLDDATLIAKLNKKDSTNLHIETETLKDQFLILIILGWSGRKVHQKLITAITEVLKS